jgi:hypothetical protein
MSNALLTAAWPMEMPPTAKSVLISMADSAKDTGHCWPSIAGLTTRTCYGKTAVIDAIKWLEANGFIVCDRSNGRKTTYIVQASRMAATSPPAEPVREPNRSASRTGPRAEPVREAESTGPRGGQDRSARRTLTISNHKETKEKTTAPKPKLDLSSWPEQPSELVLDGWLAMRKKKRADVTPLVISAMNNQLRQAAKIGWSVDDCLTEAALRNWTGMKAEWLTPKGKHHEATSTPGKGSAAERIQRAIDADDQGREPRGGRIFDGACTTVDR